MGRRRSAAPERGHRPGFQPVADGKTLAADVEDDAADEARLPDAVALRVGSEQIITYDSELAEAANTAGLSVLAPGAA